MHGSAFTCGPTPHNRQTEIVKEPHWVCPEAILPLTLWYAQPYCRITILPSAGPDKSKPALSTGAKVLWLAAGF